MIITVKRKSWRRFCESMEKVPEVSRLCRILAKSPDSTLPCAFLVEDMGSGE